MSCVRITDREAVRGSGSITRQLDKWVFYTTIADITHMYKFLSTCMSY